MWNRKNRTRRIHRRSQANRNASPLLETVEPRVLLANLGLLQGTAFADGNGNNHLDPGESLLAGALVQLKQGSSVIQSMTTLSDGAYRFTGLAAGTYQVVETPPSYYANAGTQANSPLNPILASPLPNTINVKVLDLSQLTVTFDSNAEFSRKAGYISFDGLA